MDRLARLTTSRRRQWLVLVAFVLLAGALSPYANRFEDAQENDPASFLPANSEALRVIDAADEFPSGVVTPAIAVFRRDSGLTPRDQARIDAVVSDLAADLPRGAAAPVPPVRSEDGTSALVVVPITAAGDEQIIRDGVDRVRSELDAVAGDGLQAAVSGPAGFSADAIEVFEGIDTTLLLATGLLVFVLLLVIYRSPIFWFLPLFAVVMAEFLLRGAGTLLADTGVVINGQTAGIALVLIFGAGTDYALLVTARYREELRRVESKHAAMRVALRQAAPTVIASAATVVAGLLCLLLAVDNATAGLGPLSAAGVAIAMATMLTLLPALLLIGGRRAFWPFVPHFEGAAADSGTRGVWRRLGEWIDRRHRPVAAMTALALAVLCLGLLRIDFGLTSGNGFRGEVESVTGQELIARAFPAGANAPTTILVRDGGRVEAVRDAVAVADGVAAVGDAERAASGSARFDVTLDAEPFSTAAYDRIAPLRAVAKEAGGPETYVGGGTAEERDKRVAADRDTRLLVPLVLAVVLAILVLLLRALVAPVVLIATVVLSYVAALGASVLLFDALGYPRVDPGFPLFAFIFLVALGVDYNIFLMARVREEALVHGTREGMLRALALTGGVITSAGVVLAGTFLVLGVLPLVALTQIGLVVALGVLLDTIVVRSILVPALTFELRDRIWLPSALGRRPDR